MVDFSSEILAVKACTGIGAAVAKSVACSCEKLCSYLVSNPWKFALPINKYKLVVNECSLLLGNQPDT